MEAEERGSTAICSSAWVCVCEMCAADTVCSASNQSKNKQNAPPALFSCCIV